MAIRRKPDWHIPESQATPESVYRRSLLKAASWPALLGSLGIVSKSHPASGGEFTAPSRLDLSNVPRNSGYVLDRPITAESLATSYNNFYEFGSNKDIKRSARSLEVDPWTVSIDGVVENAREVDVYDLIGQMPLEERLYRLRCVEAWSMAIPWVGFPLRALVDYARPLGSARFLQMQTFHDPSVARGQRQRWYPWPYQEGLTIDEATNDLAFLAVGMYGKSLPPQNGAPIRLVVPWKYGFKSIKSVVRFTFTEHRPETFWETIQYREYGFWANVNPDVPHPRWSQASEKAFSDDLRRPQQRPTLLFNGYAEQVASLYQGMESEGDRLFR